MKILNCRIDSDKEKLEILHQKYKWIPGRESIRPNEETLRKKYNYMDNVRKFYACDSDYILEKVFKIEPNFNKEGKLAVDRSSLNNSLKSFQPNEFPYNVPKGTFHYIMWYIVRDNRNIEEEDINRDIFENLKVVVGNEEFNFVWYENPKMTVPDLYHVQVFWRAF